MTYDGPERHETSILTITISLLEPPNGLRNPLVGLTAGPDGLYFSDLYKDLNYVSPIDRGANIYRLKYIGP